LYGLAFDETILVLVYNGNNLFLLLVSHQLFFLNLETVGKKPHSYLLKQVKVYTRQKKKKRLDLSVQKLTRRAMLNQNAYPGN
jgi:hypothetical protein